MVSSNVQKDRVYDRRSERVAISSHDLYPSPSLLARVLDAWYVFASSVTCLARCEELDFALIATERKIPCSVRIPIPGVLEHLDNGRHHACGCQVCFSMTALPCASMVPGGWSLIDPYVHSNAAHICTSLNVPECKVSFGAFTLEHHPPVPPDWMGMF